MLKKHKYFCHFQDTDCIKIVFYFIYKSILAARSPLRYLFFQEVLAKVAAKTTNKIQMFRIRQTMLKNITARAFPSIGSSILTPTEVPLKPDSFPSIQELLSTCHQHDQAHSSEPGPYLRSLMAADQPSGVAGPAYLDPIWSVHARHARCQDHSMARTSLFGAHHRTDSV